MINSHEQYNQELLTSVEVAEVGLLMTGGIDDIQETVGLQPHVDTETASPELWRGLNRLTDMNMALGVDGLALMPITYF